MNKNELNNKYFEWLYKLAHGKPRFKGPSYRKLLFLLHNTPFTYSLDMDSNRWEDGKDLRYKFGYECSYSDELIVRYLSDEPCSILEMMLALSIRCEENIMCDSEIGNRTRFWFWLMIENLGIGSMYDTNFDKGYIIIALNKFINREYGYHGNGGLFSVSKPRQDMRDVEIWYQMCWYLDEYMNREV